MKWEKKGLVFDLEKHKIPWVKSHAMLPTPLLLNDRIRVFYTGRDIEGQSKVSYVDFDRNSPTTIIYIHDRPLFDVGKVGTFDDSGVLCTCVIEIKDKLYMYYTAYSMSVKVPYRNSIGLAISEDKGNSFRRLYEGPIVDRTKVEPYFVISPFVVRFNGIYHLWYGSATEWIKIDDKMESLYHIKYAFGDDGINWQRDNISCIFPKKNEANARPFIIVDGDKLKMWYTYRKSVDFRDGAGSYRIGYAESSMDDPTNWKQLPLQKGLDEERSFYDNSMQAYPSVVEFDGRTILYYNGNGFGYNGFCMAELLQTK